MLDRVAEWVAAFDSTGTGRVALAVAAVVVVAYAIVAFRGEPYGRGARIALVVVLALAAVWVLNDFRQRDLAAEQRALENRALELTVRAVMPG